MGSIFFRQRGDKVKMGVYTYWSSMSKTVNGRIIPNTHKLPVVEDVHYKG